MAKELLNIVDDNDEVIGVEDRERIHKEGLLHREVHVYFITPNKEIIFQRRAKDKDTFPGLLDATAGGHVEIGDSYEKTAIKETFEECGLKISYSELIALDKRRVDFKDLITGKVNHAFQKEFAYLFSGNIDDLKIEAGKATGFQAWPVEKIIHLSDEEKLKFIPYVYEFASTKVADFIENEKNKK